MQSQGGDLLNPSFNLLYKHPAINNLTFTEIFFIRRYSANILAHLSKPNSCSLSEYVIFKWFISSRGAVKFPSAIRLRRHPEFSLTFSLLPKLLSDSTQKRGLGSAELPRRALLTGANAADFPAAALLNSLNILKQEDKL